MMSFFESIGSFFSFLFDFIENFIQGFLTFIDVTLMSVAVPGMLGGLLPPIVYTSMVVFIGVTVVRKIFGR